MYGFTSHALSGSCFIIFSVWWTVQIFKRFYQCKRRNARFTATVTYPCDCLCGRLKDWPLEALLKLLFVSVGFIVIGSSKYSIYNKPYAALFFMFGLAAVVDILVFLKAPIPPGTDYAIFVLTMLIEALFFKFSNDKTTLSTLVYELMIYAIIPTVISLLIEMNFRHNILAPLARVYFILLQGTWFWQIGFILYNPISWTKQWQENNRKDFMLAIVYFTIHCAVVFIFMVLIGVLVKCYQRSQRTSNDDDLVVELLMHGTNENSSNK